MRKLQEISASLFFSVGMVVVWIALVFSCCCCWQLQTATSERSPELLGDKEWESASVIPLPSSPTAKIAPVTQWYPVQRLKVWDSGCLVSQQCLTQPQTKMCHFQNFRNDWLGWRRTCKKKVSNKNAWSKGISRIITNSWCSLFVTRLFFCICKLPLLTLRW